jgi:ribulose-phosphate 3-epimerase
MSYFWDQYPTDRLMAEASLWSADFTCFREEILRVDQYMDLYHIDVADNHFVPGLLFFPDLIASLRPLTDKAFHVHLMVDNPLGLIDEFASVGANLITVQAELGPLVPTALKKIHNLNMGAGLALGLDVPVDVVLPYLQMLDIIVLMGTALGVKGAEPSPFSYSRISIMQSLLKKGGSSTQVKVEADGGIREHTVPALRAAGTDLIVMGSLAFKSKDLSKTLNWVHGLAVDQNGAEGQPFSDVPQTQVGK